jgi:DNA-binding response OmpR family regulator
MSARRSVLLVEDDTALARGLRDLLSGMALDVSLATDGTRGLEMALEGTYALIVLDVMLPGVNGYEICRQVRELSRDVPILMLTARGQEQDVILGLNVGADDYLRKPFSSGELKARVQALLRRRASPARLHTFGECQLDTEARVCRRRGAPLELTAKEYRLVEFLVQHPHRALSRDAILNAVWGRSVFVTQRSVDRCVTTLRAKIERDPKRPVHILTLREVGYRFEPAPGGAPDV